MINIDQIPLAKIKTHCLSGLAYSETQQDRFRPSWKNQLVKNKLAYHELLKLEPLFREKDIEVTILKGFSLMGDIYPDWGSRFASDIDLLIEAEKISVARDLFIEEGYKEIQESKWKGNNFKATFTKTLPLLTLTIEVHTKLFWHLENIDLKKDAISEEHSYKRLCKEDQLIHLCGHLGFQHTFIKLFWLFDIKKYVEKYSTTLDWDYFWDKSKAMNLRDACSLVLSLVDCKQVPPLSLKIRMLKALCSEAFLIAPRNHYLRYFLIKVFIKDRLADSLNYLSSYFLKIRSHA